MASKVRPAGREFKGQVRPREEELCQLCVNTTAHFQDKGIASGLMLKRKFKYSEEIKDTILVSSGRKALS